MGLKNLSKLLIFGILLNSIPINSFAGILSEDTRYEIFEGNSIKIDDTLEEDAVDIEIEGNTLVNIWNLKNISQDDVYPKTGSSISFDNNKEWVNIYSNGEDWITPSPRNPQMIKPDTEYTVIFEISDSTFTVNSSGEESKVNVNIGYNKESCFSDVIETPIKNGVTVHKLRSKKDISGASFSLRTQFQPRLAGVGSCKLRVTLLEGDVVSSIPNNYFSGLQSSFEDQLVTQEMVDLGEEKAENLGKYKVEYKSSTKNLLPNNFLRETGSPGTSFIGKKYPSMFKENPTRCRSADLIEVKPNTSYTVNYTDRFDFAIIEFDKDKRQIIDSGWVITSENPTYKTSSNCKYIILVIRNLGSSYDSSNYIYVEDVINKIQLEEGLISTPYEPYKESINTFYLNSPLLEGDTIEYINGQAVHIHRYDKIVFNGSDNENWQLGYGNIDENFNTIRFKIMVSNNMLNSNFNRGFLISNYPVTFHTTYQTDIESLQSDNGYLYIRINKGKLSYQNELGLKSWLQSNPVTLVYKLADPIYEPIKADLSVNLFEGTTHISNNSNIPATMEVTVDRALNRAVEYSELAKTNPTINNLSKARYWSNLLRESIKKDQLQEEINNLIAVNDMTLERKSVTANLDLYIKSQNALIMSLNTNSITFEDFSGVEDTEKVNAMQISINSSLPYSLNAYLSTEIQNADKTSTMDKRILNIKENSKSNYQTFASTTDKVILKDNCPAGNNLIHGVDIKLSGGIAHEKDVYKTTIKFEVEQK